MWSGDTDASWATYRNQIAIGLHFCASGIPYWTMDIGAFFVKPGNFWYWDGKYEDTYEYNAYCEFYTRWYQFDAFLPMFRAHGTDCRRELWNFKGEFYDAIMKANRLRYQLMPYIYSEAGKVWLKDNSIIRWLAFDFSDDKNTWEIKDQFLFGECMMACPVVEPMYYGNDENNKKDFRTVYFPKGCDWYDFYTGEKYSGGTTAEVSAKLDEIPLFVKGGSMIPVKMPALSTEEQEDEIEWKIFGDSDASYEFYDDDGDGYGYENEKYSLKIVKKH